ncbi:uncharacterized protein SAPINGB_P002650 [Magnusiomyces paraingens]|uniref:Serine aminopeptidase S33 domain-containing protein n=1 Tax=Magnusiomyces paraingens TaxID=2606893 RepID=A0A5E8BF97_9ASCO|nr:uncharacterized protein SAPINGB_P002650 [Saprochaete ingens]VVT50199.1 unnamed protein product [Saprochaete ingens]
MTIQPSDLTPELVTNIRSSTFTVTADDGLKIYTKRWHVPEPTKRTAVLLFNHGFGSRVDNADNFMPHLARLGFEVVLFDQRGAGKTSPGPLYALTDDTHVYADLDRVLEAVWELNETENTPEVPLVLWGTSMGGGIILNYGIRGKYRERVAGYAAFAPLVTVHPTSRPGVLTRAVLAAAAAAWPTLRRRAGLKPEHMTHDAHYLELFREAAASTAADAPGVFSVRMMHDMLVRGERLEDAEYVGGFVARPVGVFHSETDKVNDYAGARTFFELLPDRVPVKKFYTYEDSGHALMRETLDRVAQVVSDLVEFVELVESEYDKTKST